MAERCPGWWGPPPSHPSSRATASGAHPHPPTHALHRTVTSLRLMHRKTQLQGEKMFHSSLESRHLHALESSLCRCGCWRVSLTNPASRLCWVVLCVCVHACVLLEEAKQSWQLQPEALWPVAWWPRIRCQCCFAPAPFFFCFFPFGTEPLAVHHETHKGHTHVDLFQYATLGLRSLLT